MRWIIGQGSRWTATVVTGVALCLFVAPGGRAAGLASASWVAQGPAPSVNGSTDYLENASGRIVALAGDPNQPNVLYLAAAGGGVWKTSDGGTTWVPTTDGQATLFMGALAVAPSSPNIVYAGTGEANMGF